MKPIIGIDLGTTNSEVAIVQNGNVSVLQIGRSKIVPSVVSFSAQGEVLVGEAAVNNELANPQNTVRWVKRQMGSEEVISFADNPCTPPMISAMILKYLKSAAEDFLKQPISQAVITVPAFFNEKQREATQEAARLAGLDAVRLLNEPTAAALAYSLKKKEKELCMVYDLGGGTFDVSIVSLSPSIMEVKSSHGDTALGGSDIDRLIAEKARKEFLDLHGVDLASDPLAWVRLLRAAEAAKIRLSSDASVQIIEEFIAQKGDVPLHLHYNCLRTEFEEMVTPLVKRTIDSVRKALDLAEVSAKDLDRVILVGGATYMPIVAEMLERELHLVPQAWIDPSTVVARGAAIEAAYISGQSIGPYMVDITPHSLGIACLDSFEEDYNHILIHRNSPIPCAANQIFQKAHPDQASVSVQVYQGESRQISQNKFLGKFLLTGLDESPGDDIHVKFELDRSGILHVMATDVASGKKETRIIKKMEKACKKNMELADLEPVFLHLTYSNEPPAQEEDWEELENNPEPVTLDDEQLLAKVELLLQMKTLDPTDHEELSRQYVLAKNRDKEAMHKLSELLYYLT
jgi:molecular chaperone DnaK